MEYKSFRIEDLAGNAVPGATVNVYLTGTTTHATGLQNFDGGAVTSPFTADAVTGKVGFRAPNGTYDIVMVRGDFQDALYGTEFFDIEDANIDRSGRYDSVQALLDSTDPARGEGKVWQGGARLFTEAAVGAFDYHEITAGGVGLYEAGDRFTTRGRAESGDTLGSEVIYIGDLAFGPDPSGTALTTGDGRTWSPAGEATLEHSGATGDGVTDDTAAIQAAEAYGKAVRLMDGKTYLDSRSVLNVTLATYGSGQIIRTDGGVQRKRGKIALHITEPVSDVSDNNDIVNGFDADFRTDQQFETVITGADTAGDPAVSYVGEGNYTIASEIARDRKVTYFESGKNKSFFNTGGRTGYFVDNRSLTHNGYGDAWESLWNVSVYKSDPGVDMTHGVPAGGQLAGTTRAFGERLILQNIEMTIDDNGYDVVGKGIIINLQRDNADEDEYQFWSGVRLQSGGTEKPNAGYQLTGDFLNGLDFSVSGDIDRAIALKSGQGIHFEVSANFIYGTTPWATSQSITTGDYREYEGNVYQAASTGTTGGTPPTHSSGTVSDGGVSWAFFAGHSFRGYGATDAGTRMFFDTDNRLKVNWRNATKFSFGSTSVQAHTALLPSSDNTLQLGTSSSRWSSIASRAYYHGPTGTQLFYSSPGSPEGVITAPPGSTYTNSNGGAGTTFYVKESGTGNTGWVAK